MSGAAKLDRRVQFQRQIIGDDGYGNVIVGWQDHGSPVSASRTDVSDMEKATAGSIEASLLSRFVVRSTGFTLDLDPKDRLTQGGLTWNILAIKEAKDGRHRFLEITARARTDG